MDIGPCPAGWYAVIPSLPMVAYASDPDTAVTRLCDLLDILLPPTPTPH